MRAFGAARARSGQSAVEFALLVPVILLLGFGLMEFSLLLFGAGAARYAAGEGAHAASESGADPGADLTAVDAVRATPLGGTSVVTVSEVDIYKVDLVNGSLQQDTTLVNRYRLSGTPIGTPAWLPITRSTAASHPEFLGVTVKYTYNWKEGLLGSLLQPIALTSSSWVRLEPTNF
jgi:Flp pilus assembly protein TadG